SPGPSRGPLAVPLVFGLIALIQSVLYLEFNDRYLVVLLPSALVVSSLGPRSAPRRQSWIVGGVALLALWSIWWERDYLQRQGAVWQAGAILVGRGVPPERIDGGFEWNE